MNVFSISGHLDGAAARATGPTGARAAGQQFEAFLMEAMLRPLNFATGHEGSATTEIWSTAFRSHLSEVMASQYSLGIGQWLAQQQTQETERQGKP